MGEGDWISFAPLIIKNVNYNDLFPFKLLDILRFREQNEQENILYGYWEKMTSHETFVKKFNKVIKYF